MPEKIEIRKALRVFEKIRSYGHKTDEGCALDGITAVVSFDGYTSILKNDYVTLTLMFHNKFYLEATNDREKNLFLEKLDLIEKSDYKNKE